MSSLAPALLLPAALQVWTQAPVGLGLLVTKHRTLNHDQAKRGIGLHHELRINDDQCGMPKRPAVANI